MLTYTRWVGEAARLQSAREGLRDSTPKDDEEAQELLRQARERGAEEKNRRQQLANLEKRMSEVPLFHAPWVIPLRERVRAASGP